MNAAKCGGWYFLSHLKEKRPWAITQTWLIVRAETIMINSTNRSFRRAQASRSTRRINARARVSGRGMASCLLPSWDHTRRVVYESILEMKVLHLLLARPDIWDLWEQPERIRYIDADQNSKFTVFDFLITLRCGRKIAIAVKPAAIVEETGFRQELKLIRASTPLSFADDIVLVTDRSFTPAEARNAERLQEFCRTPDGEADHIIRELLRGLQSETTIAELVASSGLDGRGFRAAFRAIYTGGARLVTVGDISPKSQIMAGGAQ